MATPVIMPKFGMAQEDGTILRWLKQEGEPVERGETLLEVQTDKVDMEVEAPATGILRDVRYGVDATVPVTTVIAMIADPAEEVRIGVSDPNARPREKPESTAAVAPQQSTITPGGESAARVAQDPRVTPVARRVAESEGIDLAAVTGTGSEGRVTRADVERASQMAQRGSPPRVAATPAARRLARETGIDLTSLTGSGPGGRIQAADVSAARGMPATAEQAPQVEPSREGSREAMPASSARMGEPLRGKRRTIAARLSQSWQSAPHIFLTAVVDMSEAEAVRTSLAAEVDARGAKLTVTVLLARAVCAALVRWPRLNAWLRSEGDDLVLEEHAQVNLGIAVALEDGLIVPVVAGAESMGLAALAQRIGDLSRRARAGSLLPDEVSPGSFSLSNLGMYPVEHFTAIINPPQVAILACGQSQMQPVWNGEKFQPRPVLRLTLSADHRAVDGAMAAGFLAEVKANLESPQRLLL